MLKKTFNTQLKSALSTPGSCMINSKRSLQRINILLSNVLTFMSVLAWPYSTLTVRVLKYILCERSGICSVKAIHGLGFSST